jgi:hypothetical protein
VALIGAIHDTVNHLPRRDKSRRFVRIRVRRSVPLDLGAENDIMPM